MATTSDTPAPDAGSPIEELVGLARTLGAPPRAYAVLGEGNVSARADEATFLVKASGTSMAVAMASSFVRVDLERVLALVQRTPEQDDAVGESLGRTLATREGVTAGEGSGRPSVEAGMHAVLLARAGARWVAHTHPTPVTAVLCSSQAQAVAAGALFPDQVVVCGPHPLFLPYVDPGLPLARALSAALDAHRDLHGAAPKAIYLQNHGFVALGASAVEVLAITDMAVKAAWVLTIALGCGGPTYLSGDEVRHIAGRSDEHYRQRILGLTPDGRAGDANRAGQ